MDAHPHVVISNEFYIFKKFNKLNKVTNEMWRTNLYDALYSKSMKDATKKRANDRKGYSLKVDGMWQGRFDGYIEVIGDKSGGATTTSFLESKENFTRNYRKLESSVGVPLRIIFVLRNPFDMIATASVIRNKGVDIFRQKKISTLSKGNEDKFSEHDFVDETIESILRALQGAQRAIDEVFGPENVLEIHNSDLVADPRGTVSKIFEFLEVETTERFLDACEAKVFKSVSRSRDMVAWTPEQIQRVESWIKDFGHSLKRYSFTSD